MAYIRFIALTPQDNSESEVTGEELDKFRGRYLKKNTHSNDFSTEKAFQRNFRHLYFECRSHIELHMPIAIVLTTGTRQR
jgi:hypothetical protein